MQPLTQPRISRLESMFISDQVNSGYGAVCPILVQLRALRLILIEGYADLANHTVLQI